MRGRAEPLSQRRFPFSARPSCRREQSWTAAWTEHRRRSVRVRPEGPFRRLRHRGIAVGAHRLFDRARPAAARRAPEWQDGWAQTTKNRPATAPRQVSGGAPRARGSPGSTGRCRSTWNGLPPGQSTVTVCSSPQAKKPFQPANRLSSPGQSISLAGWFESNRSSRSRWRCPQPCRRPEHRAERADHQRLARACRRSCRSIR